MTDLAVLIKDLSPEQRRLLQARLAALSPNAAPVAHSRIPRLARPGGSEISKFAASDAQESLFYLDRLDSGAPAYNLAVAIDLSGTVDQLRLERALTDLVARHEALRTTFEVVDGRVMQLIGPTYVVSLPTIDLGWMPESEREREMRRIATTAAQQRLNLLTGPLFRCVLVRMASEHHVLLLTLHHIISDGWSIGVVLDDLTRLYSQSPTDGTSVVPELPIDFADVDAWRRQKLADGALDAQLAYWAQQLKGVVPLELPLDRARPAVQTFNGRHLEFELSAELTRDLRRFCQREGVTPYMALLATFALLLHRACGQDDITIGSPTANRDHPDVANLIGCFSDILVMRADLSGDPTIRDLVRRVRQVTLGAFANQDVPFTRVVETLQPERSLSHNPLFQVMFSFLEHTDKDIEVEGLKARLLDIETEATDFDLFLEVSWRADRLAGALAFNTDLFEEATGRRLLEHFRSLLEEVVAHPDRRVSELVQMQTISVAASFTAEPIRDPLGFWMRHLDLPSSVVLAPYGQVFQTLLDPAGPFATNARGANVVLLRLEDWRTDGSDAALSSAVHDFAAALEQAAGASRVPYLLLVCPPSAEICQDEPRLASIEAAEVDLLARLSGCRNVTAMSSSTILESCPLEDIYDAYSDREGHVPYTSEFFAALATLVARRLFATTQPPYKVVVLDCDQTLWRGVCGEDGPAGVELDGPRRMLQEFMIAQHDAGMLLCLCSKNNQDDVAEVFRLNPDMPLRPEHVVASRINWSPKSENLRALADELRLGLNSFILVDDSPVECAEVRAACPEVLVLELPSDPGRIPRFLSNVWAFDHVTATAADAQRTELYQQEQHRQQIRRASVDMGSFLASLDLQVRITPLHASDVARVAQLTQRTNQFNTSVRRHTEADIEALAQSGKECVVMHVSDRFGSYGLVGAAIFEMLQDTLNVETLLLSCRALGRGAEHRLLAHLAETATARHASWLQVAYTPGARNAPARHFLDSLQAQAVRPLADGTVYEFDIAAVCARLAEPTCSVTPAVPRQNGMGLQEPEQARAYQSDAGWRAVRLAGIAARVDYPHRILEITQSTRGQVRPSATRAYVPPRTSTETLLADIWARTLHLDRVGADDQFFDLGGHSLLVMKVLSEVRSQTGVDLPLQALLQAPTVRALARAVEAARGGNTQHTDSDTLDLVAEAQLDPSIKPARARQPNATGFERVLLTGATGFIGAFLLAELVRQTRAQVYCLVRGGSDDEAKQRLTATLADYSLDLSHAMDRIIPVRGDLARPRLGLADAHFDELAETIDTIYHSGAFVNFAYPYAALKPTNVDGTREILRLACRGALKSVHYLSTLAIFEADRWPPDTRVDEQPATDPDLCPEDAYARSKWVAERLVLEAGSRGLPVSVYRLDDVGGSRDTGACDTKAFTWRLVKGCIELGSAPIVNFDLGVMPVDDLARIVLHLSRHTATSKIFHVVNSEALAWSDLVETIRRHGYPLRSLAYDDWLEEAKRAAISPEHGLYPILGLLPGPGEITPDGHDPYDTELRFDNRNTLAALLQGAQPVSPTIDRHVVRRWLTSLAERGFIPRPVSAPTLA